MQPVASKAKKLIQNKLQRLGALGITPEMGILVGALILGIATQSPSVPWYGYLFMTVCTMVTFALIGALHSLGFPKELRPKWRHYVLSPYCTCLELMFSWPLVLSIEVAKAQIAELDAQMAELETEEATPCSSTQSPTA